MEDTKVTAKLAIRDTLLDLIEANNNFKAASLSDSALPAWVMDSIDNLSDRERGIRTATQLTYTKEQNRQETLKCPGIIAVSSNTILLGNRLNKAKENFKQAMNSYRSLFGESFSMTSLGSKEIRETLLGHLKLQHLHFVQSYRRIRLFPTVPERIGFSWAATHTGTVKMTAEKAIDHLRSKFTHGGNLQKDIQTLEGLPGDTQIVIKRHLSSHLRANLTWSDEIEQLRDLNKESKKEYPAQINAPTPLFICLNPEQPMPEFNKIRQLDTTNRQARLRRKDACLKKLSQRSGSVIYTSEFHCIADKVT